MKNQFKLDQNIVRQVPQLKSNFFLFPGMGKPFFYSAGIVFTEPLTHEKQIFDNTAEKKRNKVQNQMQERHVFVIQVNIVAGG